MAESFSPKLKVVNILDGKKPEIGSNYQNGIVVAHTITGVRICENFESGIDKKTLNCPICPKQGDCNAYNLQRTVVS